MTEREKIEILQKKAEIPEVVRKKMQLAYGQIRQEKWMHEEIEGQKNERGKTVVSKKKVAIILAAGYPFSGNGICGSRGIYPVVGWIKRKTTADKGTGRRTGRNRSSRIDRSILHQPGNHGYCIAEYYRSEFQSTGVFSKRILSRNERTARI